MRTMIQYRIQWWIVDIKQVSNKIQYKNYSFERKHEFECFCNLIKIITHVVQINDKGSLLLSGFRTHNPLVFTHILIENFEINSNCDYFIPQKNFLGLFLNFVIHY